MNPNVPQDACDLLDADHIAVKHLFVEHARLAMAAPADTVAERQALARQICQALTVHAQIEEEIFYPALRDAGVADALVDNAEAEHQQAKALIGRIQKEKAGERSDELVTQLARAIEVHVKEERDHLFPKARSGALDLEALGGQLRQRQEELMGKVAA